MKEQEVPALACTPRQERKIIDHNPLTIPDIDALTIAEGFALCFYA